jgi:hypothetical protein
MSNKILSVNETERDRKSDIGHRTDKIFSFYVTVLLIKCNEMSKFLEGRILLLCGEIF